MTKKPNERFVDLSHRLNISVVRHIPLEHSSVRSERGHEVFSRVREKVTHLNIRRICFWNCVASSAFYRNTSESRMGAQEFDGQRHVRIDVAAQIESGTVVGVEDADLDRRCLISLQ